MYYDYEDYYEPSIMDELLEEFQQKCKEILLDDINSKIGSIKHDNEYLKKENDKLKAALVQAEKDLKESKKNTEKFTLMETLTNGIKNNVAHTDDKDTKIYEFLNLIFEKDYIEKTYDVPLWIGAMTQFYSNKETVIEILKMFDVKLPDKIENFRLPIDWNEEELDMFFDTVNNHVNCNGCTFEDNLRFWGRKSLDDVKTQCYKSGYSEIPWQYVLRNPLIKKEKYLKKIGQNAFTPWRWNNFYRIDKYQDLSEEEIKIILNNIDYTKMKNKGDVEEFVLRHLKLIENDAFLEKIYSLFYSSYEFRYQKKILDMPYKYILKWACDCKNDATRFIEENKEHFTEEQRRELLMKALGL
jgi:hypothetical protein